MGIRFDNEVLRFFHPGAWDPQWHARLIELSRDIGRHSVDQMRAALAFVRATDPYAQREVKAFTLELAREVARADLSFIGRIRVLRRALEAGGAACAGGALAPRPARPGAPPWAAETGRLGSSTGRELSAELLPPPLRSCGGGMRIRRKANALASGAGLARAPAGRRPCHHNRPVDPPPPPLPLTPP